MIGTAIEGLNSGTSTGVVVNLGTTAVTSSTINTALGTTVGISAALTEVAAGKTALVYGTQSALISTVSDTISNIENVTGTTGSDYIVGSTTANTIIGGSAADVIVTGTGADIVKFAFTDATELAAETGSTAGTNVTYAQGTVGDTVTDFVSGTDKLHFAVAGSVMAGGTGTDTLLSIVKGGTVGQNDRFVHITDTAVGDNVNTGAGAVTVLNALTTATVAIGDSFYVAMDNDTDTFLYYVLGVSAADTIAAQDVTLMEFSRVLRQLPTATLSHSKNVGWG